MIRALKNYAVFKGRATRSEFWNFMLGYIAIAAIFGVILGVMEGVGVASDVGYQVVDVAFLVLLVPWLSVMFRRLHDLGRGGWGCTVILVFSGIFDVTSDAIFGATFEATPTKGEWLFWLIFWLIFVLIYLVVFCWRGTRGDNRYGPDPLAPAVSPLEVSEQSAAEN